HGDRLFAVDAAGVARRLRAHPRIKDAQVRVRPPQTLAIMVTERTPVLALGVGDRLALIDDEGVVVDLTDSPAGLVMVADRTGRPVGARRGTPAESEAVGVALKTLPAIPAELRGRVVEVVVDAGSDVTLVMRSGLRIRVGALAGLTQRLEQVPGVLDAMSARGVTVAVIDLRYAGSIVVRPHAGGDGK
ncbi:MAG: FtsQ-type POTRA domain-containing protein, partial [Armatimonadetes bacterium]|nr:FtsQ-type POTRA domain-containing protein [Armatimonadota bacterium]